ncbi:TraB/GumN family protein [Sulfuriflexus mobilis]|uniref:TraB/GumN family protein n=1 Tax=Sulfuriflexus mobilis TaxID=1811807 RepID=UPI000F81E2D1|nr:TraB/GumN family protein [Sulfuriflexus mobilis]
MQRKLTVPLGRLLFGLHLLLAAVVQAEPTITFLPAEGKGILWQLDSPQGKTSYLFGTIHVDDPRITNLHPSISQAIARSRSMTLELVPDPQTLRASMMRMFFSDGQTLQQAIGDKLYKEASQAMAGHGMPPQMVAIMKPWAVMMTLSVPKQKSGEFLDLKLYNIASQRGMQTHALESYEEQLSIFDSMSPADQKKMLAHTLADLDQLPAQFEKLRRAWLDRDLAQLERISNEQLPGDDPAAERFMNKLLDERNQKMLQRMQPRLREGNAFIAVGALHLAGEQGLLNLLERQGYMIKAIY